MDIYLQKDGRSTGPFSEAKIRLGIDSQEFSPQDLAWVAGKASWQPLSALIDLDTTKPPPLFVPEQTVAYDKAQAPAPVPSPTLSQAVSGPPPPSPPVIVPEPSDGVLRPPPPPPYTPPSGGPIKATRGRLCRRCGAPYSLFSGNRAMFSGLCVACSWVATGPFSDYSVSDDSLIVHREQALKVVRYAGIFHLVLGAIWIFIGVFSDASYLVAAFVYIACGLGVWKGHSRVAAVVLLLGLVLGTLLNVIVEGVTVLVSYGIFLTMFQFGVTIKAVRATFKLRGEFAAARVRAA